MLVAARMTDHGSACQIGARNRHDLQQHITLHAASMLNEQKIILTQKQNDILYQQDNPTEFEGMGFLYNTQAVSY